MLRNGQRAAASKFFQKAVDITPDLAGLLITCLREQVVALPLSGIVIVDRTLNFLCHLMRPMLSWPIYCNKVISRVQSPKIRISLCSGKPTLRVESLSFQVLSYSVQDGQYWTWPRIYSGLLKAMLGAAHG